MRNSKNNRAGLTMIELLVIIAGIAVLAALLLPALAEPKSKVRRISCTNNLKQVGLGFRVWANDHNGKFPMELSATNGGASEALAARDLVTLFEVMSNELNTPKILYCPADDLGRRQASAFGRTSRSVNGYASTPFNGNSNITYFVGMDVKTNLPSAFLSGDDNFMMGTKAAMLGILLLTTNTPVAWNDTRHARMGNIALADGSVQGFSSSALRNALANTGLETNRLALP